MSKYFVPLMKKSLAMTKLIALQLFVMSTILSRQHSKKVPQIFILSLKRKHSKFDSESMVFSMKS